MTAEPNQPKWKNILWYEYVFISFFENLIFTSASGHNFSHPGWINSQIRRDILLFVHSFIQIPLETFVSVKVAIAVLYTVEMILIIVGRGVKQARKHGTFVFDFLVWLTMIVEFICYAIHGQGQDFVGFSSGMFENSVSAW